MSYTHLKHPEEKVLAEAKTKLAVSRNHTTTLSIFGITNAYLDDMETKINTTQALRNETAERIVLRGFTHEKDEDLEKMYAWCRSVKIRTEEVFGKDSVEYRSFPLKELIKARHSVKYMSPTAEIVINLAEKYATKLEPLGLTSEVIQEGKDLLHELRMSKKAQNLQKVNKKNATELRHKMFNELVGIINYINKVGRIIYKEDPVNLVYFESPWETSNGTKEKVLTGEVMPEQTVTVADNLPEDTYLLIENTGEADLNFYSGVKDESTPILTLSFGEEDSVHLFDIGNGENLNVENPDKFKKGRYKIRY